MAGEGEPWLPGAAERCNVAELQNDARSILQLFRELIRLRKNTAALRIGDDAPLRSHNDIVAYERFTATDKFRIALKLHA